MSWSGSASPSSSMSSTSSSTETSTDSETIVPRRHVQFQDVRRNNNNNGDDPDALNVVSAADLFPMSDPNPTRGRKLMQSIQGFFLGERELDDVAPLEDGDPVENMRFEASGAFKVLPDELVAEIFDWLEVESLGRMAQTCWRMNRISEDVPMLAGKARRGKWIQPGVLPKNTRSFYKDSFKNFKSRERTAAISRRVAALDVEKLRSERRAARGYKVLFGFVAELFSVIVIWVSIVRGVLMLDGQLDSTWDTVFMPLIIPALQLAFGNFIFGCMLYGYNYTQLNDRNFHLRGCCSPGLFFALFIWPTREEMDKLAYTMLLPTGVASFFVAIKLSYFLAADQFPFVVCAVPIILQMLVAAFASAFGVMFDWDSDFKVERFVMTVEALLWLSAVLLLALKLDNYIDIGWYETLIPSFLTFTWFPFYTLWAPVLSVMSCTQDFMNDNSYWNRYNDPCDKCWMSMPFHAIVIVPILTFLSLIATNLEFDRFDTYAVQFAPAFWLLALLTVGWIALRIRIAGR